MCFFNLFFLVPKINRKSWAVSSSLDSSYQILQSSKHDVGVSINGGTLKSSIQIGFSIINYHFWGTSIHGTILCAFTVSSTYASRSAACSCYCSSFGFGRTAKYIFLLGATTNDYKCHILPTAQVVAKSQKS